MKRNKRQASVIFFLKESMRCKNNTSKDTVNAECRGVFFFKSCVLGATGFSSISLFRVCGFVFFCGGFEILCTGGPDMSKSSTKSLRLDMHLLSLPAKTFSERDLSFFHYQLSLAAGTATQNIFVKSRARRM